MAQQSNMQPDLRKLICEHIIRVLQHQKDVNQKQHICVKHDFVNLGGRTGTILRHSSVPLKSKNQEINRLVLAVKLHWAIFFESVDILS
ncbi:hypothetical protein TNCV_1916771 [Trichonephila clavipes]|uniref:Uncharacterized protein n=1 Tax=Trichonephila clavipes TaxID=2585209 RepID=A0A8X6W0C8_TRICX|nr:hypothetical protein TNCV_1916771 [Trichonephila clavipes]